MKKAFVFFAITILSLTLLSVSSCKDDDPKDNVLFTGTYKGRISYTKGLKIISEKDGKVTVNKVGDKYSFNFSNDIPSLKGIKIEKGENKFDINWGSGSIITIDAHKLHLFMTKDGEIWTANCSR